MCVYGKKGFALTVFFCLRETQNRSEVIQMNTVLCVKFQFLFGVISLKENKRKRKSMLPKEKNLYHLTFFMSVSYTHDWFRPFIIYMQVTVHARSTERSATCQAK